MHLSNLPFYLTLFSGMLPPVAALLDFKGFVYLPFIIIVLMFALLAINNHKKPIRMTRGAFILLIFLALHGVGTTLTVGHGSLGLIGLLITSICYVQLLHTSNATIVPDKLIRQLAILYLSHVIFLVVELILRVAGYKQFLLNLFGLATNVTKMKNYNSAAFLQFLGFGDDFFGLNGMLLGSQSASQVMLALFIIGAAWYRYSPFGSWRQWIICALTFLLFLSVATMTMVLALIVVMFMMIYIVPFSRINTRTTHFAIPILVALYFSSIAMLVLYRIDFNNFDNDVEIYVAAFRAPIDALVKNSITQVLFGVGRIKNAAEAADFGIGMLMLQVGVVFIMVVGVAFLGVLLATLKATRRVVRECHQSINERKWVWLATVNALVSLVFALGLFHYTPSIELGGMQMFAFSIALCVYSVRRLRNHRWRESVKMCFQQNASPKASISI